MMLVLRVAESKRKNSHNFPRIISGTTLIRVGDFMQGLNFRICPSLHSSERACPMIRFCYVMIMAFITVLTAMGSVASHHSQ